MSLILAFHVLNMRSAVTQRSTPPLSPASNSLAERFDMGKPSLDKSVWVCVSEREKESLRRAQQQHSQEILETSAGAALLTFVIPPFWYILQQVWKIISPSPSLSLSFSLSLPLSHSLSLSLFISPSSFPLFVDVVALLTEPTSF